MSLPDTPPEPEPPSRLGGAFWLLIGFGFICIIGGYLLAVLGPRLWPAPQTVPEPPAAAASLDARLADIQAKLDRPQPVPAPEAPTVVVAPDEVQALSARLERLELSQKRSLEASAAALAVASLDQAARVTGPFSGSMAAAEPYLPASPDLARLRALSQTGAPSRAALAAEFPPLADKVVTAVQAKVEGDSWWAQTVRALAAVVTVRRLDRASGSSVDAVLARAEARVRDGDLEAAVVELDTLPPAGREAAAPWRERALRRIELDQRLGAIRAAVLRGLDPATPGA